MYDFFRFSKTLGFFGILGPPFCGIGATIRIGREMLCLPYAEFLNKQIILPIYIILISKKNIENYIKKGYRNLYFLEFVVILDTKF